MKKDVVKDIMERNGSSVVCGFFSCAVNSMISENLSLRIEERHRREKGRLHSSLLS